MESCISLITALYWRCIKNSEKKLDTFEGLLYNILHYLLTLQERFTFWNNALEELEFLCHFFTRDCGVIGYYNRGEIDGLFYSHFFYFQETVIARIWKNLFRWRKSASFACMQEISIWSLNLWQIEKTTIYNGIFVRNF